MPPPRFYRTLIFWFGLPGLLALLWGWLAFPSRASGFRWNHGGTYYGISDCSRMLVIGAMVPNGFIFNSPGLTFKSDPSGHSVRPEETRLFPPAWLTEQREEALLYRTHRLAISYWILIACHLALWLPLLLWWQRRALTKATTPIAPA